jgi:hypothetical protein
VVAPRAAAGRAETAEPRTRRRSSTSTAPRSTTPPRGRRAADLAERFDDAATFVEALVTLGTAEYERDGPGGSGALEAALDLARRIGDPAHVARTLNNLAAISVRHREHESAARWIEAGLAHCAELDLDLWRLSILSVRVLSELE